MNTNRTGAAVIGAVVLIVAISGCAGVQSQLEGGAGASSVTSLQSQQDAARQEAALERSRAHAPEFAPQGTTMQDILREAERTERIEAAARAHSTQIQDAVREAKQAEVVEQSAADVQGQRLAEYAEKYGQSQDDDGPTPTPEPRPISPRNR
ncbi:hypothetical protein [Agromyces italicus]|uniref:hypothetical protein n=1 Tax=Agromyces italicus TaxID=279572 RepID=UPI0003B6D7A1|nr:hypothetical protein [Agromyces italicus]